MTVWTVFIAATITAVFTGIGALPFFFVKNISGTFLGAASAAAAGLMLGASLGLIYEGFQMSGIRLVIGIVLGILLIVIARYFLEGHDPDFAELEGNADAMKILLIVGIMTVHSFAEGIGVGVSFGDGQNLGTLISSAIAIHNIPEGLAISLVLIPRGSSVWKAAGWSVFSSLPQPLMAVPAFLFVLAFKPFLPVGLGLAAGAMVWMVFSEMLPEAREEAPLSTVVSIVVLATLGMLAFQLLLS
jgi:ZIP family zinc transporter